jgi:hypothetical protein
MAKTEDRPTRDAARPVRDVTREMVEQQEISRRGAVTYRPSDRPRPAPPAASTPMAESNDSPPSTEVPGSEPDAPTDSEPDASSA